MKKEVKNKTAIILSGGGTKSAYCVGALLELHNKGIYPDILIAGSGSSGTASYYVANQLESINKIWTELLSTRKFINIFRLWKILNIDYLIDIVFKKTEPLNVLSVKNSNILYLISATHSKTGEVVYFSNKEKSFDVFETMRDTMSFPLLYNLKINSRNYEDGIFSASTDFHIKKARELGAEKIILIDCGVKTNKFLYKIYLSLKPKQFRKLHLSYLKDNFEDNSVIKIKPNKKIKKSLIRKDKAFLKMLIKKGKELEGFNS